LTRSFDRSVIAAAGRAESSRRFRWLQEPRDDPDHAAAAESAADRSAGTVTLNVAVQPVIVVPINGRHRYDHSAGTIAPRVVSPFTSVGATWDFAGMP
jgi:hypothetical protein